MVSLLVPEMVRNSMRPLQEALESADPSPEPEKITNLVEACSFLTSLVEQLWEKDCRVLEAGSERRMLVSCLQVTQAQLDATLTLLSKAGQMARSRASAEALGTLEKHQRDLQELRAKIEEILCWLETPLPPIDPAAIPAEGQTFQPLDKALASL